MERLKAAKSAFILEARSLVDRGLVSLAPPFYLKAAQLERELAEIFASRDEARNSHLSLFSAASCLVMARQYRTALEILESIAKHIPEAVDLMEECGNKEDAPVVTETRAFQKLIELLVRKGHITSDEWAEAVQQT